MKAVYWRIVGDVTRNLAVEKPQTQFDRSIVNNYYRTFLECAATTYMLPDDVRHNTIMLRSNYYHTDCVLYTRHFSIIIKTFDGPGKETNIAHGCIFADFYISTINIGFLLNFKNLPYDESNNTTI